MGGSSQVWARDGRIAVTGIGLVTPMARTTWRSVAALLHNRSRFAEHGTLLVAGGQRGTALRGAIVSQALLGEARHGLTAAGLGGALLRPALAECLAEFPRSMGEGMWLNVVSGLAATVEEVCDYAAGQAALFSPDRTAVVHAGRHDRHLFIDQIRLAVDALTAGACRAQVVACVDSLCFLPVLEELLTAGRLTNGANPEGIIPGEAAGALLLEREEEARRRGAPIYACIASLGSGFDPAPMVAGRPSTGRGLTEAFHRAFDQLSEKGDGVGLAVADLNGERQRAAEWALTEGRVFGGRREELPLWLPAFVSGDCGAAIGAVQAVLAIAVMAKGKGGSGQVAISSLDDSGGAQVLCFGQGDFRTRHDLSRWRRLSKGEV